jgi:hypothetical protein
VYIELSNDASYSVGGRGASSMRAFPRSTFSKCSSSCRAHLLCSMPTPTVWLHGDANITVGM